MIDFENDFKSGCIVEFKEPMISSTDISRFGFVILADINYSSSISYFRDDNQITGYEFQWLYDDFIKDNVVKIYNDYNKFIFKFQHDDDNEYRMLKVYTGCNGSGDYFANEFDVKDIKTGKAAHVYRCDLGDPYIFKIYDNYKETQIINNNNNDVLKDIYDILGE